MNVPLTWLAEYVKLPPTVSELTDRLTMIGHMLDKKFEVDRETVIDLELRGNRADLFGLLGIARDISAAWDVPLTFPPVATLPQTDPKSTLVTVKEEGLVDRFLAFTLSVTVAPSPDWLVARLKAYGMPSINNVVDITNYVMIETGEPMHAYNLNKLKGKKLLLRRGKNKETMKTLLGTTITLTDQDLVIADTDKPQGLTMIGGDETRVTDNTTDILLEAAVYNQANVRRSARRLGIRTEAGNRHEKHLDPYGVAPALARALYLLEKHANAKVTSKASDFFPHPPKAKHIILPLKEMKRLTAMDVSEKIQTQFLTRLGCEVHAKGDSLQVTAPTFRTDIHESADLVEEITRLVGYEKVPVISLSGVIPPDQTSPSIKQENEIREKLVLLQLNEVITSTFVSNELIPQFEKHTNLPNQVMLQNPPDQQIATLRPTLLINLLSYAKRSLELRAQRVALFEIGKIYYKTKQKKETSYHEERMVSMILTGEIDTKSYNKTPRAYEYADSKGIVQMLGEMLGQQFEVDAKIDMPHPSLDPTIQGTILCNNEDIGAIGMVDPSIGKFFGLPHDVFAIDISLDVLLSLPKQGIKPYVIAPSYPPAIEDISLTVPPELRLGELIKTLAMSNPLVVDVRLLDTYENKRTLRVTYQDATKTLSAEDIRPVREKLLQIAKDKFKAHLVEM